jgi:glycosyltransferase involved in cell wall biosynthesis
MTWPERSVLVVSLSADAGGAERSMLTLVRHLPTAGWRAIVAVPPGMTLRKAADQGTEVRAIRWFAIKPIRDRRHGTTRYPVRRVAAALAASTANVALLARLVLRERPDVVLSNSSSAHLFVMVAARLTGRPVVWHLRDIVAPGRGRAVLARAARGVSAVVAISQPVAATLNARRVHVVVNPVELEPTRLGAKRSGERPVIGYLGRLDPEKGLDTLIRAMADVPAVLRVFGEARYAPVGYEEELKRLASCCGADVRFEGRVDEPETALSVIDVLAVPSRLEPWGRVAAEALVAGVPVVASRSGGLPEIVRHGDDGLLVEPEDVTAWADALRVLAGDAEMRRRMSDSARAQAHRFAPVEHAHAMGEVLDSLVAGVTPRVSPSPPGREDV